MSDQDPRATDGDSHVLPSLPDVRRHAVPIFATPISNYLWPGSHALNTTLLDAILTRAATQPSKSRSNVGGWHSDMDFFEWKLSCTAQLHQRLHRYVSALFESVATQDGGHQKFRLEGWANVLGYGHYHSLHAHPNAFWSGVYYVTGNPKPPGDHPFSGKLELVDPRPNTSVKYVEGTALYGRFLVNPVPGQMVIFPGWLQHHVHPFFGEGERVTVAFNVIAG